MASGTAADSFVASEVLESDDSESDMNALGANSNYARTIAIKAPPSFSLFPKLPVELRLKIWRYASFEQRNVDIWVGKMRLRGRKSYKQNPHYFYSTCSHPVVLHLSREARFEAEKHYSLYFGAWAESTNTTVISSSQIYVNPMADRICIMDSRIGFSPTAHDDLMQIVYDIEPIYLALNTDAKEDIDCWVDNLHGYVEDLVLFHRYPEPPKSGERVSLVFESLDHKYAPQSLPREAQWAYQYILEEGKHDCEVSVRELKWKSQVELTGKT